MSEHFDDFAENYSEVLQAGLLATGEGPEYFVRRRIEITGQHLMRLGAVINEVMDFGCGAGLATSQLLETLKAKGVVGVDVSRKVLAEAARRNPTASANFTHPADFSGSVDFVFCNGVFHHIEPAQRSKSLLFIHSALRTGGFFALWENNPWNPGTRYVMSKCDFDAEAKTLSPRAARRLLRDNGFKMVVVTSAFFFPRALKIFRRIEHCLSPTLLGGQYMILCRKS
jgi:trans-aconitate methyltransferase